MHTVAAHPTQGAVEDSYDRDNSKTSAMKANILTMLQVISCMLDGYIHMICAASTLIRPTERLNGREVTCHSRTSCLVYANTPSLQLVGQHGFLVLTFIVPYDT